MSRQPGVVAPPDDTITFGREPDPDGCVSLRDVFDRSYRRLVAQLYAVTGSFDEAEDVVQEAFVRAAAAGRRFLRVDNHEAWLRTTAVNVHRSRWRKLRNGRRANERMLPPREPEALEDHLEIITALRALPEPQRQVIALHHLADLPVDQIAEELNLPVGTVKSRLSRGREALASLLDHAEGGTDHV
jgi:RNA polymerase sigma-70 factor, ECF subfamily